MHRQHWYQVEVFIVMKDYFKPLSVVSTVKLSIVKTFKDALLFIIYIRNIVRKIKRIKID